MAGWSRAGVGCGLAVLLVVSGLAGLSVAWRRLQAHQGPGVADSVPAAERNGTPPAWLSIPRGLDVERRMAVEVEGTRAGVIELVGAGSSDSLLRAWEEALRRSGLEVVSSTRSRVVDGAYVTARDAARGRTVTVAIATGRSVLRYHESGVGEEIDGPE